MDESCKEERFPVELAVKGNLGVGSAEHRVAVAEPKCQGRTAATVIGTHPLQCPAEENWPL